MPAIKRRRPARRGSKGLCLPLTRKDVRFALRRKEQERRRGV